jgi:hypothetical protein
MGMRHRVLGAALAALVVAPAAAQWGEPLATQRKGEGALVIRDGAPAYTSKSDMEVKRTFRRGEAVAGFHKEFVATIYEFFEENGRVRVLFPKAPDSALLADAWMDPADLETFVYDCCDAECIPVKASLKRAEWNPCFKEGMNRARASLPESQSRSVQGGRGGSGGTPKSARGTDEKPLTNEDVVALVKAELGDDLVIGKIRQAPQEALDVSTDALVRLKKQGVSKAVLDAMLKRAGER